MVKLLNLLLEGISKDNIHEWVINALPKDWIKHLPTSSHSIKVYFFYKGPIRFYDILITIKERIIQDKNFYVVEITTDDSQSKQIFKDAYKNKIFDTLTGAENFAYVMMKHLNKKRPLNVNS